MNFEIHGSKSVSYNNIADQNLKPEEKAPLAKIKFTYKEESKPSDNSTSITGPAVRLVATFLTLGISEDIHKKIKKKIVATLSKALTQNARSARDRQDSIEKFKQNVHYDKATSLSVQVGKTARLDGMLIKPALVESKKYVIWLNGLGEDYEGKLTEACIYADKVQANILLFNYRGCGDSTTDGPTKPKDLVTDTLAMIAFLTEQGIEAEDIVIHGFSLGGGVGAQATQQIQGISHINDRSYSTFSKAIREFASEKFKEKIGETAANVIGVLSASLIKGYDLDLDTEKVYKTGINDTLILHHPNDRMIRRSSLKNFLSKREINLESTKNSNHKIVELSRGSDETIEDVHNTFFNNFQGTAELIAEFIHNKSFASLHFSDEEKPSLIPNEFPDYENLAEDLIGFANFTQISNRSADSANSEDFDFDIEGLGDEKVLNLKPKNLHLDEI